MFLKKENERATGKVSFYFQKLSRKYLKQTEHSDVKT